MGVDQLETTGSNYQGALVAGKDKELSRSTSSTTKQNDYEVLQNGRTR